ncbi:hypothetical protein MTR_2g040280 [Medicago truncatula]|uniref:Uncharacterized protein n=1 Tax=Medicago truncatula TaxID=3880 RepID=G7IQA2_MEDTR|nr:hypothetical protein MTR_2g040280 [Medicago truncatula]
MCIMSVKIGGRFVPQLPILTWFWILLSREKSVADFANLVADLSQDEKNKTAYTNLLSLMDLNWRQTLLKNGALWDSNGQQTLPKNFNVVACPRLDSNSGPWLNLKRRVSSRLSALGLFLPLISS